MTNLKHLDAKEKAVLRKLVLYTCEGCRKHEDEVGLLTPHRLIREHEGGTYHLRNIKMLCKKCHRGLHSNEFPNVKGK